MPALSSRLLRFDLYRDSLPPNSPGSGAYIGLWQHQLAFVDGLDWIGLFLGPFGGLFQLLEFDNGTSLVRAPAALSVLFDITGTSATVRNELGPAQIKNILVDTLPTALRIEGFLDVFVPAAASADGEGRQITVVRAAQGRIELGDGDDRLVFEAFAQRSTGGFTITVDAGAGDDEVIITPGAGLWREQWFTVNATLGDGDDRFVGMGSNDTVFGGAGDDWAELRGGTNFFDGGAGYDSIVFRGDKATYRIDNLGQGRWRIWDYSPSADGDDGITVFRNVERVIFKDQVWELAPPGSYNNPPIARDDGVFAISGVRVFTFAELLANDSDPEGQPLTVLAVSNAVGGTAVRNWQDNTVVFTPNAGFTGEARFTYTASDRNGGLADAVVRMVVGGPANRPPVAVDDAFAGTEDTPLAGSVALNDSDPDGDPLTFSLVGPTPAGLVLSPDGSFTYTPPADLNGAVAFTYRVSDGKGGTATATATITLAPVEDAPIALDDAAGTPFETPVVIAVLANDLEVDGQPLSVILWSAPASGSAVVNADNTITFTPEAGFSGEATFTYRPFDGVGFGNVAQVVVRVGPPPNRPPVANDVVFAIDEDTPFIANMFGFTSDPDLNQASIAILGTTNLTITRFDPGTGEIEVQPLPDFFGVATITYQVTDAGGLSDSGVVTLTVVPVDDPPVGVPDTATTRVGTMVVIDVLANDYDAEGEDLYAIYTFTLPTNGFVIFFPGLVGGPVHYTPNPGFVGTDSFTYTPFTIRPDGTAVPGNETTVTVTVVTNTAPVANADVFMVQEGRTLTVAAPGLLANDSDPDGDAILAALFDPVSVQGGTVTMVTDGSFTYTPPAGFVGADSFTYAIFDGIAYSAAATVTITVVEGTPIAAADAFTVRAGQTLTVNAPGLLANDTDPNGDAIIAALFDPVSVQGGTVTMVTDGSFTYTPPAGFIGTDSFTYVISDGVLFSAAATVTITVTNTAPVAIDDSAITLEDLAVGFDLGATDAENNIVGFTILSVLGGTVIDFVPATGTGIFVPTPDFNGTAAIFFRVADAGGLFDDGAFTIAVIPINDAPVGVPDSATTTVNTPVVINVLANDVDVDGDPLSAGAFADVVGGTLSLPGDGTVVFTPSPGFIGTGGFTYRPFDGGLQGNVTPVTVTVATPQPSLFTISQTGELARPEGNPGSPIGFVFEVTRTGTDLPSATLTYALGPGPGTSADGGDLVFGFGTFTIAFAAGQTSSGIVSIAVTADTVIEPDETFSLALVGATAGTVDPTPIVFTILDDDGLPPPPAGQRFYFSGLLPEHGRELWVYDPAVVDPGLGTPFATMVDEAEMVAGPRGTHPTEITALGDTVFWRDLRELPLPQDNEFGNTSWYYYNPLLGPGAWFNTVYEGAFDEHLPIEARNLSVRSGDLFWFALGTPGIGGGGTYGYLSAIDAQGVQFGMIGLEGSQRTLLSDAGRSPAYAGFQFAYSVGSGTYEWAEQLFVLHDVPGFGWDTFATFVVDPRNDIREIAGLRPVGDPLDTGQGRTVFFAGDYLSVWTGSTFHADALWRVDLLFRWMSSTEFAPRFVDLNGTGGAVPLSPHALTVVPVTDGQGGTPETLFLFGTDAFGGGRIFAYRFDPLTGVERITSSDLVGAPLAGLEIAPWIDGVVFSALGDDGMGGQEAVVATWTDGNGDGFYDLSILFGASGGVIEHLVVDGQGNAAWVLDAGDFDRLYTFVGGSVELIVERLGEIDEVQMAGGHLVYRTASLADPNVLALFDHVYGAVSPFGFEVPTDELTGGVGITSFWNAYRNVAIPGALVFEAYLDDPIHGYRLFVTDGTTVHDPAGGFAAASEGAVLNGAWVGTGYRTDLALNGLFSIAADGTVTTLHASTWNMAFEAEVLDDHVLFGTRFAPTDRILLYDSASGMTDVLLDGYELGSAEVVGSRIIFSARDETRPVNADADPSNDIWELWSWSLADGALFLVDLPGSSATNPVMEWWRHQDFLGDDSRVFWKQNAPLTGIEVWMIDLAAAVPGATLYARDVAPYGAWGANHDDAVFANGRLYWQASTDGTLDTLRLWTTTDVFDAVPVTGPQLWGGSAPSATGYQLPYRPVVLDGEVFFLARIDGTDRWGIFQVNDDGLTASLITPDTFGSIYGLAAVGAELIFFARDPASNADQMWQIFPESTPVVTTPFRYTAFAPLNGAGTMDDIFLGGDANYYFGRFEPDLGRELWVLDTSDPRGARVVIDLNQGISTGQLPATYAPEQVVAVPNPLEYWLAG